MPPPRWLSKSDGDYGMLMNSMNFPLLCLMLWLVFSPFAYSEVDGDPANTQIEHAASSVVGDYRLGSGDLVKITVFNQESLSGEYTVSGNGQISMPLIGAVNAKDVTLKQLEQSLVEKLKPDYLLNPRISIQVLNYRPFYILGEVKEPQSYPFVDGMTYLNAVAIAGGFTYRAKEDHVMVTRMNDPEKKEIEKNMDEKVMPGDVIRVEERFF